MSVAVPAGILLTMHLILADFTVLIVSSQPEVLMGKPRREGQGLGQGQGKWQVESC